MKTPIETIYANHGKNLLKIIYSMHPNDVYDFLADNDADPWMSSGLTHDYLIDCLVIFCAENAQNADLLMQWFDDCNSPIPEN